MTHASMGPRPFGRGRVPATPPADDPAWLQWGRDLSVAEGDTYDTCTPSARPLQWGRDLSVAEGCGRALTGARPLLLQWGRDLSVAEGALMSVLILNSFQCFNGAATFRSRKGGGGGGGGAQERALQWGRDLSVAEGSPVIFGGSAAKLLQWGRDLSVAEGGNE